MEGETASISAYVISVLQAYGLAGLVMGVMAYVIRALWKDNVTLRDTLIETGNRAIEANSAMTNAMAQLRSDILNTNAGRRTRSE